MPRCKHCQRFYNMLVNAKKVRPHHRNPSVSCSHEEFLAWSRRQPVQCSYCRVREEHLQDLSVRTSIGRALVAMGIDRVDNGGDYALDNIQYCCLPCNKAKGSVFTHGEMLRHLGPAIAAVWAWRRAAGAMSAPGRPSFAADAGPVASQPCPRCGGTSVYAGLASAERRDCSDCARWNALIANARRPRKRIATPGVELDEARFMSWARQVDHVCAYCGIPEPLVPRLRVRTQVGHALRFLGIDRADNSGAYRPGNIVLACFPCNKAKGNVFSSTEMETLLGPAVGRIWVERLANGG